MTESSIHKKIKKKEAGKSGKTESKIKYGGRRDAETPKKVAEIQRTGGVGLDKAIKRLIRSKKPLKKLIVPQRLFEEAKKKVKKTKSPITIKNISQTKKWKNK